MPWQIALDTCRRELEETRARLRDTQARLAANAAKFDEVAKNKSALAEQLARLQVTITF